MMYCDGHIYSNLMLLSLNSRSMHRANFVSGKITTSVQPSEALDVFGRRADTIQVVSHELQNDDAVQSNQDNGCIEAV